MRFPKFTPAQSATLELLGSLAAALAILAFCGPLMVHPVNPAPEACQCPGVCEMAGCTGHRCPCNPNQPEIDALWASLGVSDWGDIDEQDLSDPEVCETLDRIEALGGDR